MRKIFIYVFMSLVISHKLYAQYSNTTIKTPSNVSVDALIFTGTDFDSNEVAYWDAEWEGNWDIEILESSTQTYNCHGYAWHKVDGGGTFWVNDVDSYGNPIDNVRTKYYLGSTPSYTQYGSNYRSGLKVSYYPRDHSAVTTSTPHEVLSKWAWGPFVKHNISETDFYAGSTIKFYEIPVTGSSPLCSSPAQTYTTLNISGASYSWSGSNVSISGSSHSVSATATSSGTTGAINVSITSPYSGTTVTGKKAIWVGIPASTPTNAVVMFGPSSYELCRNMNMMIALGYSGTPTANGATQANWNFGSWASYVTGYDDPIPVPQSRPVLNLSGSASSSQFVSVAFQNACGSGSSYSTTFYAINCGSYRMTYPNPAKDVITLSFDASSVKKFPNRIELYSEETQKLVHRVSDEQIPALMSPEKTLQLSVKELPRGTYYIHLSSDDNESSAEKVRIVLE